MDRSIYEFDGLPEDFEQEPIERGPVEPRRADRLVGVLRNPKSHRNKGEAAELPGRSKTIIAEPANRNEIPIVLTKFARSKVHYLVIDGGDGTIRDVLTAGAMVFGDNWPTLIILPSGKTNALAVDLGMPQRWSLREALDAIETGGRIERQPIAIRPADGRSGLIQGFILGAGLFTNAIEAGQDAHRWGAFNSLAVAVTIAWMTLRAFWGANSNPIMRGAVMQVRARLRKGGQGYPLPHSGMGDRSRRFLLLASTLERFPLGMQPFSNLREGLRLAVVDAPKRRMLMILPALMFGYRAKWITKLGGHRCWAEEFEMDIGGRFILDGEAFPPGRYSVGKGPRLRFVTP